MRYTAERCNEWRNCVAETMTKALTSKVLAPASRLTFNPEFVKRLSIEALRWLTAIWRS